MLLSSLAVKSKPLCLACTLVLAIVSPILSITLRAAESDGVQRVSAAFVLAFGRMPTTSEIATAKKATTESLSDLVTRFEQDLRSDQPQKAVVAQRARLDVFGPESHEDAIEPTGAADVTYFTVSRSHLHWLAQHRAEYEQVVQRAYRHVIRRNPYPEEIAYWNARDVMPYMLLAAAIEHWARRNQPGLMVTSGRATVSLNSEFLTTVQLSVPLASEAAAVLGAPRTQITSDLACATGHNVLAVGGESLVSDGGIPFVAAGRR